MKEPIKQLIFDNLVKLGIHPTDDQKAKIEISYPDPQFGDYATNVALIMSKDSGMAPKKLAERLLDRIDQTQFESISIAGPGFINFRLKTEQLIEGIQEGEGKPREYKKGKGTSEKILLEYFQPNIAKPLHIGHLRTAIIGDALKRMMLYLGMNVESDTHIGDWGTQFGLLILAYKNYGDPEVVTSDPIPELNKLYVRINEEMENVPSIRDSGKREFVKLEAGDAENRQIWKQFVDWSMTKFNQVRDSLDLLPFEHGWPESFFEDQMPAVVADLKAQGLLVESQGAQIVDLEAQKLGVAIIIKSDGGTTYLLRDLATFIFCKQQGFAKHLYVVDSRQSHHYQQLFAILKLMKRMTAGEAEHIDYGFISFKGAALSTRKGNMILAEDVLAEARARVAKIIKEKNPELANKEQVIHAVAVGAVKYFDLVHNRHSDFEFDWDEALSFDGVSGPYLQYAHARLSGILSKVNLQGNYKLDDLTVSSTERELMMKMRYFPEVVQSSVDAFLPNIFANYLYDLAALVNKFYHESPVMKEEDEKLKYFRLLLIRKARETLKMGLYLLGIEAVEEM